MEHVLHYVSGTRAYTGRRPCFRRSEIFEQRVDVTDGVKLTRVVSTGNVCSVFFKRPPEAVVTRAIRNGFYPRYESYGVTSAKLMFYSLRTVPDLGRGGNARTPSNSTNFFDILTYL